MRKKVTERRRMGEREERDGVREKENEKDEDREREKLLF